MKYHKKLCHQIQRIVPPHKIHSRKLHLLKAKDSKLSLNLRVTNRSFLVTWQIISNTSLSALFQKKKVEENLLILQHVPENIRDVKKLNDFVKPIMGQSRQVLNQVETMEKFQQKILWGMC